MFGRLVLLFTVIPALEIYLLIQVGSVIGGINTMLLIVATGVVGAHYTRMQGFAVVSRLQESMYAGRTPANELVDGAMLLLGGAMLLTPGLLTDAFGLSLVFPPSREFWKRLFLEWLRRKIQRGEIQIQRR